MTLKGESLLRLCCTSVPWTGASLIVFLAKIIRREWPLCPGILQTVALFLLSLSADLKRRKNKGKNIFLGDYSGTGYTLTFCLASSISSLACCMASQRCLMRSPVRHHKPFLDMEAVDDPVALGNAVRTILRMESDKSSVTSSTALRCSSSIRCRTAITSSAFVPATTATKDCSACGPHGWLQTCTAPIG